MRALFLSLAVLLSLPMMAAVKVEIDGINYELNADTKEAAVIAKSRGNYSGNIVIPESVTYESTDYIVTSIGDGAFQYCTGLTSVTIGNSVTSIGESAFSSCSNLKSVTIPNSVTSIGEEAFYFCDDLTSVTIGNSVTSIGDGAFQYCTGLTSVTIGNSVTSIGWGAFYYCSALTSVIIPNSVTSIGGGAFQYCTGLTSVTIPNSVTSIGSAAFHYCSGLTSVTIGNGVTSIEEYVFFGCSSLASVTIGNSVTSIEEQAFRNTRLQTIICRFVEIADISSDVFDSINMYNHTQVYVPEGTYWDYAFSGWGSFVHIKEMVMDAEDIEKSKAYMIADASGRNYTVYNAEKDKLVNVAYTHALDEESEGSCWTVLKDGNAAYLYNIGAKKYGYVTESGTLTLSNVPVKVDIASTEDGLSINGNACMFVLNSKIGSVADGIEELKAGNGTKASVLFDLNGRRVQKAQKGLYIQNGRKVLVK